MNNNSVSINKEKEKKSFSFKDFIKFLGPSLLGILLFMIPISYGGEFTIPIAILSNGLKSMISDYLPMITTLLIIISFIFTMIAKLSKSTHDNYFNNLFNASGIWLVCRILGAVFALATLFGLGTEMIYSGNTGGLLLFDLLPVLFSVFLFAGFFLPLLLNYGMLEFFGVLFSKFMRPIFTLPGRSSIDCIASWLGDGTIGVLLTSKQYEEGFYTKREAAVIGTTFSAVSITFSLVVLAQVNLQNYFLPYYLTIILTGIVSAIIMPRIYPLVGKSDSYVTGEIRDSKSNNENISINEGLNLSIQKAKYNWNLKKFLVEGSKNVLDMWLGVIPVVMAMGTIALIVAEYTPVFTYLGMPLIPLLNLLHIPEAAAASQTFVIGFADMFLPSVLAASIESELTRFVVAGVSVTQLIYMSEVGGLLLGSKIPVSFKELIIIFMERTLISLPIFALVGHILF